MVKLFSDQQANYPDCIVLNKDQIMVLSCVADINDMNSLCKEILLDTQCDGGQDIEDHIVKELFSGKMNIKIVM